MAVFRMIACCVFCLLGYTHLVPAFISDIVHRTFGQVRAQPYATPEPDESLKASLQGDTLEVPSASVSQPLLESNAEENQVNGTASNVSEKNGSLQLLEHTNNITQRSTAGQRCANVFFSTFLLLLLLLAMSIALFERNDTSDWIENTAWLSHVRHSYYEPARHVLLDKYHTFFLR